MTSEPFDLAIKSGGLAENSMAFGNAELPARFRRATSLLLSAFALLAIVCVSRSTASASSAVSPAHFATTTQIQAAVQAAETLQSYPSHATPSLETLAQGGDFGDQTACQGRNADASQSSLNVRSCTFGMKQASRTVVLTGDSRAGMWFATVSAIATAAHYRLIFLAKYGCPSAFGVYKTLNNNGAVSDAPWTACSKWHTWVTKTIAALHPQLVLVSSSDQLDLTSGGPAPAGAIETGFEEFFKSLPKESKLAVLGGFPIATADSPTLCLSKSPSDPSKCAAPKDRVAASWNGALQTAAAAVGATYIDQSLWLCATTCPGIIAGIVAYTSDGYHIDATYAHYLTGALWTALEPDLA